MFPQALPQESFGNAEFVPANSFGREMMHSDELSGHLEDSRISDHEHLLSDEEIAIAGPGGGDESLLGREEVFSYSPYVEGSGYQNQPSYEEAPQLSKQDISRYAMTYK